MLFGALVALWNGSAPRVEAADLALRFGHRFGEEPLSLGRTVASAQGETLSVTRCDYLVSEVGLREAGGPWRALAQDFGVGVAYASGGRQEAVLHFENLPAARFDRIAFTVGLPDALNQADPNSFAAGHPLHPGVNGLHWGWLGGYIYLALEGHHRTPEGRPSGFSYHLAGDGNAVRVELPVALSTDRDRTIDLEFDVAVLFEDVSIRRDGESTHSREGDPLVGLLSGALGRAFRVVDVSADVFQDLSALDADSPAPDRERYPLRIPDRFPRVALPADNLPTVPGVQLGRHLFAEPLLSKGGLQSCRSCHDPGRAFTEDRRVSIGVEGVEGRRNAMPLTNLAWEQAFFWDGRATTLREQVTMPIEDPHEMNESLPNAVRKLQEAGGWDERFEAAFGTPEISADRLARALEQYLLTELSVDSRFDQAMRREVEFTDQEKRGFELFVTEHDPKRGLKGADCFHCHGGMLFTNHRFANNGLPYDAEDLGRYLATGEEGDRGLFKVPSLRNVALTAPYMHDGRFATLEEVVDHYDHGIHPSPTLDPNIAKHPPEGLGLSEDDKAALVAFLRTLTDPRFLPSASSPDNSPHPSPTP